MGSSYFNPELVDRAKSHARDLLRSSGLANPMTSINPEGPFSNPPPGLPAPPGGASPGGLPPRGGGPPGLPGPPTPSGPPPGAKPGEEIAMGQLSSVPEYVAKFLVDLGRKVLGIPEGGGKMIGAGPGGELPTGPGEPGGGAMPSHGYTVAEDGNPEVVTAPGTYFPATEGEVIPNAANAPGGLPMAPRQFGGLVSPSQRTDEEWRIAETQGMPFEWQDRARGRSGTPWQSTMMSAVDPAAMFSRNYFARPFLRAMREGRNWFWNKEIPTAPRQFGGSVTPPITQYGWQLSPFPAAHEHRAATQFLPGPGPRDFALANFPRELSPTAASIPSYGEEGRSFRSRQAVSEAAAPFSGFGGSSETPLFSRQGGGRVEGTYEGTPETGPWYDPHGSGERMLRAPGAWTTEMQTTGFARSRPKAPPAPKALPAAPTGSEVFPSHTPSVYPSLRTDPKARPTASAALPGERRGAFDFLSPVERDLMNWEGAPSRFWEEEYPRGAYAGGLIPLEDLPEGGQTVQMIKGGGRGPTNVFSQWFPPRGFGAPGERGEMPSPRERQIARMAEMGGPYGGGLFMTPMGATAGMPRTTKEMGESVTNLLGQANEYRKAGLQAESNRLHWLSLIEARRIAAAQIATGRLDAVEQRKQESLLKYVELAIAKAIQKDPVSGQVTGYDPDIVADVMQSGYEAGIVPKAWVGDKAYGKRKEQPPFEGAYQKPGQKGWYVKDKTGNEYKVE